MSFGDRTARDLEDWAALLDREIMELHGARLAGAGEETLVIFDTSLAKLQAASQHIRDQGIRARESIADGEKLRRRYRAVMALVPDALVETDELGIILDHNAPAAQLLDPRSDSIGGKPLTAFIPEEDCAAVARCFRALVEGKAVDPCEVRVVPAEGPPVALTLVPRVVERQSASTGNILWLLRKPDTPSAGEWRGEEQGLERDVESRTAILSDLDESIRDRLAGLRKLARRVIELQDAEGHRLARELRERFGQSLGALKLNLDSLAHAVPDARHAPLFRESVTLVAMALKRLRELYFELSPPLMEGTGLVGMVRQLISRMPGSERLKVEFEADPLPPLHPEIESACLWVVREALANITRHAGATQASVTIHREGTRILVAITDNGRGFNVPATRGQAEKAGRFGLVGMEERVAILGGDLEIRSAPRQGTEIRAMVGMKET